MHMIETADNRYVIVVHTEKYPNVRCYDVYDIYDDFNVAEYKDCDVATFVQRMKENVVVPNVDISIKSSGCCDMNGMADNVLTHFCSEKDIESYSQMIKTCYQDADKVFSFSKMFDNKG